MVASDESIELEEARSKVRRFHLEIIAGIFLILAKFYIIDPTARIAGDGFIERFSFLVLLAAFASFALAFMDSLDLLRFVARRMTSGSGGSSSAISESVLIISAVLMSLLVLTMIRG